MQKMVIVALFSAYIAAIAPLAQADIADMATTALAQPELGVVHFLSVTFDAFMG